MMPGLLRAPRVGSDKNRHTSVKAFLDEALLMLDLDVDGSVQSHVHGWVETLVRDAIENLTK
jgi:hypothetical protein